MIHTRAMRRPLDRTRYPRDPQSQPISLNLPDGGSVYVQDSIEVIWVLPDGPHRHVRVLGNAEKAMYASDLTIEHGKIKDVTNLSGSFQFDDPDGLFHIATVLERGGFAIEPGGVRLFPMDGSRPIILR